MNKIIENWIVHLPLFFQIFRFGIVGASAALIHFSTVVFLVQIYAFEPLVANGLAFMVAFQISYFGHRLWTFQHTTQQHRVAFPRLLLVQILNFLANETLFYIFLTFHFPYAIALLIVLSVLPIFTFISSKLWVFR